MWVGKLSSGFGAAGSPGEGACDHEAKSRTVRWDSAVPTPLASPASSPGETPSNLGERQKCVSLCFNSHKLSV